MFIKSTCRRTRPARQGAAAVEFALVAPVFLIFLFGTMELGRLAMARNVITNASREAARLAVIEGSTNQQIEDTAKHYAKVGSVDNVSVNITETTTTKSVEVFIKFEDVSWLPNAWFLKDQVLSSTTTMRKENIEITTVGPST